MLYHNEHNEITNLGKAGILSCVVTGWRVIL